MVLINSSWELLSLPYLSHFFQLQNQLQNFLTISRKQLYNQHLKMKTRDLKTESYTFHYEIIPSHSILSDEI